MAGTSRPASFGPHSGAPYGDFTGRVQPDRTIGTVTHPAAFGAHAGRAYSFAPTVPWTLELTGPIALQATIATSGDFTYSSSTEYVFTPPLEIPALTATISVSGDFVFVGTPEVPRSVGPLTQPRAFGAHASQRYQFGVWDLELTAPIALQATVGVSGDLTIGDAPREYDALGKRARYKKAGALKAGIGAIPFNRLAGVQAAIEAERAARARDEREIAEILIALVASGRVQ